jgi:phosphoglycolate phosphatase
MLWVFDFDGTLANTSAAMLGILNQLSRKYHFRALEQCQLEGLRLLPAQKVIKALGIHPWLIPLIFGEARSRLRKIILQIPMAVPGLKEVLQTLRNDHRNVLGILTSNSRANAVQFLDNHQIEGFQFVQSISSLWGKYRVAGRELLYVGDEIRDIEAARKAGVRIGVVAWGYNSWKALEALQPDFLWHTPEEMLVTMRALGQNNCQGKE